MTIFFYFFLLLFNFINLLSALNSTLICEGETVINLMTDELIFFETLNFPSNMKNSCNLTFVMGKYQNDSNLKFVISFTNGFGSVNLLSGDQELGIVNSLAVPLIYNTTSTPFTIQPHLTDSPVAFQGHIYVDDWNGGCPLESIMTMDPFVFEDETQIIYLSENFYKSLYKPKYCLWRFTIPRNFMLKFVMIRLGSTASISIRDENKEIYFATGYYGNGIPEIIYGSPPYFIERHIAISYKFSPSNFNTDGLKAYVTVTKLTPSIKGDCDITKNGKNITTWKISNYPNNIYCHYNFSILFGTQILVNVKQFYVEQYVDNLIFYTEGEKLSVSNVILRGNTFVFTSQNNLFHSYVVGEFISDGSVRSAGFELTFETIECKCHPPITFPCGNKVEYNFMGNTDGSYCSNFLCNITLVKNLTCSYQHYEFTYRPITHDAADSINIFSDGDFIFSVNLGILNSYALLILTSKETVIQLEASANFFGNQRYLKFYLNAIDDSLNFILPEISLTSEKPYYMLQLSKLSPYSVFTVSLDQNLIDNDDVLEVFNHINKVNNIGRARYFAYYTNRDLTTILESILPMPSPLNTAPKYVAKNHTITVYIYNYANTVYANTADVILFRALKKHSEGCQFGNVFFTYTEGEAVTVSIVSKPQMKCEVIMIYDTGSIPVISKIWTSSKNQTCKVYAAQVLDQPLFEFNYFDSIMWKDIPMYSWWYVFQIPPDSSLLISTNVKALNDIHVNTHPFKSMWTIVNYGTSTEYDVDDDGDYGYKHSMFYHIQNDIIANFTVLVFDLPNSITLTLKNSTDNSSVTHVITHVGQSFLYSDTQVIISYGSEFKMTSNQGAVIGIETIP